MPDLPLIPQMDTTLHPFDKQSLENPQNKHPNKFWGETTMFSKTYKDQNDRIAEIYRFQWSFDMFVFKNE